MDRATIEEVNRIRLSLGQKPLPVPGAGPLSKAEGQDEADGELPSTLESRQAQAYDNYKNLRDAEEARKKREERHATLKKKRDASKRFAALEGSTLGELEEGEHADAKSWLKGQNKRFKANEKKRKAEEAKVAAEAAAAAKAYDSVEAGTRVVHDMADFADGDDQVLTLKDATVLENEEEGDELENLDLRERERLNDRLKLKKKRPIYDPNNHDETGEHSILSQYDEEIRGKKGSFFTLDSTGLITESSTSGPDGKPTKRTIQGLSLDIVPETTTTTSDYLDASEIKVKKPRKKKSKSTRTRPVDDDDVLFPGDQANSQGLDQEMDIDSGAGKQKKRKFADESFVDDDDLQSSLTKQRREALKKRKKANRMEELAKWAKEESSKSPAPEEEEDGGLVIDQNTDFIDTIGLRKDDDEEERKPKQKKPRQEEAVTTMDADGSESEDEEMPNADAPRNDMGEATETPGITTTGVEEEKMVGGGMAGTLQLLRERGIVQDSNGADLNDQFRARQAFLAEKKRREEQMERDARMQRDRDRQSGRYDRMSQQEREGWQHRQNTSRDTQSSRAMAELYNSHYKPNIELKYTDEFGRKLDQKEAFKALSHGFHGRQSGKGKTDKLLKKIESEKRREARSMLDASQNVGMSSVTEQQSKKRKEAGVRLA